MHNALKHGIHDARWTYTNVNGPQPHPHQWPLDEMRLSKYVHACTQTEARTYGTECHSNKTWQHDMQACKFQKLNMTRNSPESWQNGTRCMTCDPKCKIRHTQWPTAIQSMHNMDMEHEDRSKAALRLAFLQFMTWPNSKQR